MQSPSPGRGVCLWCIFLALPVKNGPLPAELKFKENTEVMEDCIGDFIKIGVHGPRDLFTFGLIYFKLLFWFSLCWRKGFVWGTGTASSSGASFFALRKAQNVSDEWQSVQDYGKEKEERRSVSSPFSPSCPPLIINFHRRDNLGTREVIVKGIV